MVSQSGLTRRIRQHLYARQQTFFASCTVGFEPLLVRELESIPGCSMIVAEPGGVNFQGPFELVYLTNLWLRTANRILLRVSSFTARSYSELFNKIKAIAWERYLCTDASVAVSVTAKQSRLHHTDNIAGTAFDAIKKKMESEDLRVSSYDGKDDPDSFTGVHIRFFDDHCTVSMDSTGELLHKRGYKEYITEAPLRETMAAALLMMSDVSRYQVVVDPFCGSGTFVIESALISLGRAPGANRTFAFSHWPSFKQNAWNYLIQKAFLSESEVNFSGEGVQIFGSDIDSKAITSTRHNSVLASVENLVSLKCEDCCTFFAQTSLTKPGLIIANLPYGKRIHAFDSEEVLYRQFGETIKRYCKGWNYGFVVPDTNLYKSLRLKPLQLIRFSHGGLRVLFIQGII